MFICEKCHGVGCHELGCPDYMESRPDLSPTPTNEQQDVREEWARYLHGRHIDRIEPTHPERHTWDATPDYIRDPWREIGDYVVERLAAVSAAAPDERALADEVEYRIRTAVALAKGGRSIEDEIAAGRARVAALATPPAPVVSGERWQQIVDRVASQRFTDDDGNDAGTMHSGHAVMAVTLTLAALGITVADAPAADDEGGQE